MHRDHPLAHHLEGVAGDDDRRALGEADAKQMRLLLDDRDERPGVMFSEMDLIGIPHRIVVGERGLTKGIVEYRDRASGESADYPLDAFVTTLKTISSLTPNAT